MPRSTESIPNRRSIATNHRQKYSPHLLHRIASNLYSKLSTSSLQPRLGRSAYPPGVSLHWDTLAVYQLEVTPVHCRGTYKTIKLYASNSCTLVFYNTSSVARRMSTSPPHLRMERDMSLAEVEKMSARIIELISCQKSLAQATNYAYTHVGTNNPEDVAIQYMSPSELYQYRMSKKRGVPFTIDIDRDRVESPDGAKQFPRMALALDRLFQKTGHTRENVAFIYRRYPGHIALVKAYLKLINAERDAISNADVTLDLFQEYQTCRKILGNAQYVFQHSSVDDREQSVMIRKMQTIMERRMADLAGSKLRASKRTTRPPHLHQQSTDNGRCAHSTAPPEDDSLFPSPPSSPNLQHSKSWNVQKPRFEPHAKAFSPVPSSGSFGVQNCFETNSSTASYPDYFNHSGQQVPISPISPYLKCDSPVNTSAETLAKFNCGRATSRFRFNSNISLPSESTQSWTMDRPNSGLHPSFHRSCSTIQPVRSRFFPVP